MVDLNADVALLTEYTQWVAAQKVARPDTSPEEFMKDRVRQVAFERIENALTYLNRCDMLRMKPNKHKVRAILEGTDNGETTENTPEAGGGTVDESIPASQSAEAQG